MTTNEKLLQLAKQQQMSMDEFCNHVASEIADILRHQYDGDFFILSKDTWYQPIIKKLSQYLPNLKRYQNQPINKDSILIDASSQGDTPYQGQSIKHLEQTFQHIIVIDINQGATPNTSQILADGLHSELTIAIGDYQPFHLFVKYHRLFKQLKQVGMIKQPSMLEEFLQYYPKKWIFDHKSSLGKVLFIAGSYGMASALGYNIIGAKCAGSSYTLVATEEQTYQLLASRFLNPVYFPFHQENYQEMILQACKQASAIGFGSGINHMHHKERILDLLIQNSKVPLILDAGALQLLYENTFVLKYAKAPIIITPHIKEFADLTHQSVQYIQDHLLDFTLRFAKINQVYIILKGANTLVVSPNQEYYINQSGNLRLAQAGSGDILTGILTTMVSFGIPIFTAMKMAVFFHGYLADCAKNSHAIQTFDLEDMLHFANEFFLDYQLYKE